MGKSKTSDPPDLEKAALRYLERYASSVAGLRRVLGRKLRRAAMGKDGETPGDQAAVEAVLARLVRMGLLDDARYAEFRAASLARRGASLYAIRRDLALRGVARLQIDTAVAALKEESGGTADEADRAAALALARRRRIGPYRSGTVRAAYRDRDLAALGRAGFALEIARSVIDGDPENS